jgi:hypothetical protein
MDPIGLIRRFCRLGCSTCAAQGVKAIRVDFADQGDPDGQRRQSPFHRHMASVGLCFGRASAG